MKVVNSGFYSFIQNNAKHCIYWRRWSITILASLAVTIIYLLFRSAINLKTAIDKGAKLLDSWEAIDNHQGVEDLVKLFTKACKKIASAKTEESRKKFTSEAKDYFNVIKEGSDDNQKCLLDEYKKALLKWYKINL